MKTTTEKMITRMQDRAKSISIFHGRTPDERSNDIIKKIDLLNKAKVLSEVIK